MTRSRPSRTDIALIALLAQRDVQLSHSQLERWRHAGLTPRPLQVHLGSAGSATVLPTNIDEAADQLAAVATRVRRGTSLSITAVALTVDGWMVHDDTLRDGYQLLLDAALALLDSVIAIRADVVATGGDQLEVAETIASALLAERGSSARTWRANLAAHPELLSDGGLDSVLHSAVTAMIQLLIGADPHTDAVAEWAAATGTTPLLKALTGESPSGIGDRQDSREAIGALLRTVFARQPILDRLKKVHDADASSIRAASHIVSVLQRFVSGSGLLPVSMDSICPNGDNPGMHVLAIAMILALGVDDGCDVGPLVHIGVDTGLLDPPAADRLVRAAQDLNQIKLCN